MGKEPLQVLNALDVAKTQWYHFTAIIIAGMGFFTDAYDLFCISLLTKLLGRIYYHVHCLPTLLLRLMVSHFVERYQGNSSLAGWVTKWGETEFMASL